MRKKRTWSTMNKKGRWIHPRRCTVVRNAISIGMLTAIKVIMTSRGLGWCLSLSRSWTEDTRDDALAVAAWRAVDRRDTKIELTPPGRPVERLGERMYAGVTRESRHTGDDNC